jgi:DnaJ-class molecular chaperone
MSECNYCNGEGTIINEEDEEETCPECEGRGNT